MNTTMEPGLGGDHTVVAARSTYNTDTTLPEKVSVVVAVSDNLMADTTNLLYIMGGLFLGHVWDVEHTPFTESITELIALHFNCYSRV